MTGRFRIRPRTRAAGLHQGRSTDPGLPGTSMGRGEQAVSIALRLLLGWLAALGFAGLTFALLGLDLNLPAVMGYTGLFVLLLALMSWSRKNLLVTLTAALLALLLFWLSRPDWAAVGQWLRERVNSAYLVLEPSAFLQENPLLAEDESALALLESRGLSLVTQLASLLSAFFCYIFAARIPLPGLLGGAGLVLAVLCQYYQRMQGLPWFWLLFLTAVLISVLHQRPPSRVVAQPGKPVQLNLQRALAAVLAVIVALTVGFGSNIALGPADLYSRRAQGQVDDLLDALPVGLIPRKQFAAFTLDQAGYYPLTTRLGGTADPSETPVFTIYGLSSGLLRGQTSTIYTGDSWMRDPDEDRWRFESPRAADTREQVFNPARPLLDEIGTPSEYLLEQDYHIEMLGGGGQVLFTGGLPNEVELDEGTPYQVYFNREGVLYSTAAFQREQGYQITGQAVNAMNAYNDFTALQSAGLLDAELDYGPLEIDPTYLEDDAFAPYLQLTDDPALQPGGLVYETAFDIAVRGHDSTREEEEAGLSQASWSRVVRLMAYLQSMDYSLEMPVPPAGQDFVEHVLQMQTGYCVYFASALTIMARIIGVPARYVEGYAIPAAAERYVGRGQGLEITGRQAHAWTEVYIDGLGWIALDPTPGGVGGALQGTEPRPLGQPLTTPTPSPTAAPTEAALPGQEEETDPTLPATPSPVPEETKPTTPLTPGQAARRGVNYSLLIIVPLLLLLGSFWLLRYRRRMQMSDPVKAEARYRRLLRDMDEVEATRRLSRQYINEIRTLLLLEPARPLLELDGLAQVLADHSRSVAEVRQKGAYDGKLLDQEEAEWTDPAGTSEEEQKNVRLTRRDQRARRAEGRNRTLRQELNQWFREHPQWLVAHPEMVRPLRSSLRVFEAAAFSASYTSDEAERRLLARLLRQLQDIILWFPGIPREKRKHSRSHRRRRIWLRYHFGPGKTD